MTGAALAPVAAITAMAPHTAAVFTKRANMNVYSPKSRPVRARPNNSNPHAK
jgi:hypothetical protein